MTTPLSFLTRNALSKAMTSSILLPISASITAHSSYVILNSLGAGAQAVDPGQCLVWRLEPGSSARSRDRRNA
jgi:hypothetical protein